MAGMLDFLINDPSIAKALSSFLPSAPAASGSNTAAVPASYGGLDAAAFGAVQPPQDTSQPTSAALGFPPVPQSDSTPFGMLNAPAPASDLLTGRSSAPTNAAAAAPPAAASPAVTGPIPNSSAPNSLGDAFGSLGSGIGHFIDNNRSTLLALGAGLAGAQSIGQGLSRGMAAAVPAQQVDQKRRQQNQTAAALIKRGIAPDMAAMIASTPSLMQQVAPVLFGQGKFTTTKDADGNLLSVNSQTGETKVLVPGKDKYTGITRPDGSIVPFNQSTGEGGTPIPPAPGAFRPATDAERAALKVGPDTPLFIGPDGKPTTLNSGVIVNMPPAEKAQEASYGKVAGEELGAVRTAGSAAANTLRSIAELRAADASGGPNIFSGPGAGLVKNLKQVASNLGVDVEGLPQTEAMDKLGFSLATNLTKAITARPAQAEFIRALQNVPSTEMSANGRQAMYSILEQQAKADQDLSHLVEDPKNREHWAEVRDAYYAAHPFVSPFNPSQPLGPQDAKIIGSGRADGQPSQPQATQPAQPATPALPKIALPNGVQVPQAAVQDLRRDPSLRQQFEQKFGPGSAAPFLGAQ